MKNVQINREIRAHETMEQLSDQEHWERFKTGEQKSFKYIYFTHYESLNYYALKISGDETVAKEAIQELFSSLWYTRSRLSPVKSLKAYLLTSLRREILQRMKKKREKQAIALEFVKRNPEITFSHEEVLIEQREELLKRDLITKALNNLSKRQREVVYLKYYEQLSYQEIAQIMGIKYQSVLNNLQKAFAILRNDPIMKKIIAPSFFLGIASFVQRIL